MNRSYRTIVRKSTPPHLADPDTAMNGPNANLENKLRRRNSSSSSVSQAVNSGRLSSDTLILDAAEVKYKIHPVPAALLRFIPDSQLDLIRPFLYDQEHNTSKFVQRKRYSTNVDERSYLTVFEYQLNDNWIIWDYATGYVFFTGLWKSCGNNKTDIVKLIDNFPNSISTESVRRVRGGFLKIQGTWLPFEIVKKLAKNFCFNIRYCLVPLFGEDFPDQCLKPSDKNYGKLVDVDAPETPPRSRRRSNSNQQSIIKPKFMKIRRSQSDSQDVKPRIILKSSIPQQRSRINSLPILEMEEILKASKQLHDLSFNHNYSINPPTPIPRRSSFNYGGFIWSWQNDNNLTILGKDEEPVITDEHQQQYRSIPYQQVITSPNSSTPKLYQQYTAPYIHYQPHYYTKLPKLHDHPQSVDQPFGSSAILESPSSNSAITTPQDTPSATSVPTSSSSIPTSSTSSIPKKFDGFETLLSAANQVINDKGRPNSKSSGFDESPTKKKMDIGGLLS